MNINILTYVRDVRRDEQELRRRTCVRGCTRAHPANRDTQKADRRKIKEEVYEEQRVGSFTATSLLKGMWDLGRIETRPVEVNT